MASDLAVSIVIPVRDEAGSIGSLIHSIGRQVRQPDEIVMVDGGSTDGTVALVRRLTAGDERYRIIEAGVSTPGRGRNVGIEAAAHPWVALTDAGIELDAGWLDRLARVAEHDGRLDVVYGSFRPGRGSFFERCADLAYVAPLAPTPVGPVRSRSIASCLLRKDAWRRAGGFPDMRAAEDLVFMRALEAAGARAGTAPEAWVTWQLEPTFAGTFTRFRRYSKHNVRAGLQKDWHHGVARQYLAAAALVAGARRIDRSPRPLLLAAAGLRVGRTIWRRREGRGVAWALRPDRFVTVAAILAVIDAATFLGWLDASVEGRHERRTA
ncbi:MAG: glycosyltransferase [Acidimicrobiales bacterium]